MFQKNKKTKAFTVNNEDDFENENPVSKIHIVSEISVENLKKLIDNKADFQLLDVRESHERESRYIGGDHIPLPLLEDSLDKISSEKPVILYCQKGIRSSIAAQWLNGMLDHNQVYSLEGGIERYLEFMDASAFSKCGVVKP
jgi:sulfur-carrier protein adenylyltransferase/sulfurtransferase